LIFALFYGLSAGVFEEVARYLTMRFWARDARSPRHALMLGAGHGGIEAMLLGLIFVVNASVVLGINLGYFTSLLPPEALTDLQQVASEMLNVPLWATLLGALERLFAIMAHIAMSLMVLKAVRGRAYWLGIAILWHTLLNASAVFVQVRFGLYPAEIPIAIMALLSAILIWRWVREEEEPAGDAPLEPVELPEPGPLKPTVTAEKLEDSRYQS
jgi:uncharacterized membrane protein YhfC